MASFKTELVAATGEENDRCVFPVTLLMQRSAAALLRIESAGRGGYSKELSWPRTIAAVRIRVTANPTILVGKPVVPMRDTVAIANVCPFRASRARILSVVAHRIKLT